MKPSAAPSKDGARRRRTAVAGIWQRLVHHV
jgi:hypothetical protein